jgi:hypothetical protein
MEGKQFTIYGPIGLLHFINCTVFSGIYGILQYNLIVIEFSATLHSQLLDIPIEIQGISNNEESYIIQSFPVLHTCCDQGETYGYIIKQKDKSIKFKNPKSNAVMQPLNKAYKDDD